MAKSTPKESSKTKREVVIHTDGGSSGNPGPGGWGAVLEYGEHRKELSGGYRLTTNNRMELTAAIRALEALKRPCEVTLYSDSRYVVDGVEKGWARRWRSNGWKRNKKGDRAINPDLWGRLLELAETHDVDFEWVRGHAGHDENERADELVREEWAKGEDLPPDEFYESEYA